MLWRNSMPAPNREVDEPQDDFKMATPAPPILASDIYSPSINDLWPGESSDTIEPQAKRRKLSTSVNAIDQALEGGFDFGAIHCITSEPDQDVRELLQTLLTSHLCSSRNATATVVDTSLAFDLLGLYRMLESTLKDSPDAAQDAKEVLECLKIMKVFDDVGLSEAFAEIREDLDNEPVITEQTEPRKFPKSTIEDSEDEDEILDGTSPKKPAAMTEQQEIEPRPKRRLLIIDDLSKIISPLIRSNYANGQAVLASLMRSLRHTTKEHDLCTIIFSNASNRPGTEDDTASLFASCSIRPALGPSLGPLVDVQSYLHQIPSQRTSEAEKQGKEVQMINVLEVVQDAIGMRYGRWAPFVRKEDGRLAAVS